jgi:cold shock protein
VPTGKVKWYDADKGFGFISSDEGGDVFVRQGALPTGAQALKGGQRVEFGIAQGKRGDQALNVRLVDPLPSVAAAKRRPADELHGMIEDMVKVLESQVQRDLRHGRYPDRKVAKKIAGIVRAVADELDA